MYSTSAAKGKEAFKVLGFVFEEKGKVVSLKADGSWETIETLALTAGNNITTIPAA